MSTTTAIKKELKIKYPNLLTNAVVMSGYSYRTITRKCESNGIKISPSYLSKLCNGIEKPASDEINRTLAKVLNISFKDIIEAKYRELLDPEVFEILAKC